MFELMDDPIAGAKIVVFGVGGSGGNAVAHMLSKEVKGVEFLCANTDAQDLKKMGSGKAIQIGSHVTRGLGAGANPEVGRQAAMEDRERIQEVLADTDMLFITAGMGGGTGTGAAPVVAQVAKEMGVVTVAVVTKPFDYEGPRRSEIAEKGILELSTYVDSLIVIPNNRLHEALGRELTFLDGFREADEVLYNAVFGITDLIFTHGVVNLDFADVRTVMSYRGRAMMGIGAATGENRARQAAEKAINSPLLDNTQLSGAKGILINITAGRNLKMSEHAEASEMVKEIAADDANIIVGTVIDDSMEDELRVTVVATGFDFGTIAKPKVEQPAPQVQPLAASKAVENIIKPVLKPAVAAVAGHGHNHAPNYDELEKPTYVRAGHAELRATGTDSISSTVANLDMIDIPAFLRRQAD